MKKVVVLAAVAAFALAACSGKNNAVDNAALANDTSLLDNGAGDVALNDEFPADGNVALDNGADANLAAPAELDNSSVNAL